MYFSKPSTILILQHVGSVVSISGLPSDYQDDRERRLSYSSDHWSQKGPIYSTQIQYMVRLDKLNAINYIISDEMIIRFL